LKELGDFKVAKAEERLWLHATFGCLVSMIQRHKGWSTTVYGIKWKCEVPFQVTYLERA